ncbi:hypothetical protein ACS0PU_007286 [Formica fusca]
MNNATAQGVHYISRRTQDG